MGNVEHYGGTDVLVYSAGHCLQAQPEEWEQMMAIFPTCTTAPDSGRAAELGAEWRAGTISVGSVERLAANLSAVRVRRNAIALAG